MEVDLFLKEFAISTNGMALKNIFHTIYKFNVINHIPKIYFDTHHFKSKTS